MAKKENMMKVSPCFAAQIMIGLLEGKIPGKYNSMA